MQNKSQALAAVNDEIKKTAFTVKVGDIFVEEWGFTMCLVNFYQVIGVKGKSTVIVHEIASDEKATGFLTGGATPKKDRFLELNHNRKVLTRRIKQSKYNGRWYIKPREFSYAYPHIDGQSYHFDHCD